MITVYNQRDEMSPLRRLGVNKLTIRSTYRFKLLGCAMLGVGIWLLVSDDFTKYSDADDSLSFIYTGAYILVAIGGLIMIIGFLGCCGAIRESQCMLGCFFFLLFIIFAVLLGAGIWAVISKDEVRSIVKEVLDKQIERACDPKEPNSKSLNFLNHVQEQFQCCGVNGIIDYKDFDKCNASSSEPCRALNINNGCLDKASAWFEQNILIVAGVAIGIAVVLILGMIFSIVLCCAIRDIQA